MYHDLSFISIGLKKFNLIDQLDVENVAKKEKRKKKQIRYYLACVIIWMIWIICVSAAMCKGMCAESEKHVVYNLRSRKYRTDIGLLM